MDKETLSNYGWIVICVLVLAVMIALATPFGDFIANGVKSTTAGLFSTSQNALNSIGLPGLNIADQEFDAHGNTTQTPQESEKEDELIPGATFMDYNHYSETGEKIYYTMSWEELKEQYDITDTDINESAFSGMYSLCSITIPEGITSIGLEAFSCCENLETVNLPKTLKEIGPGAFHSCSLTNINLQNITYIGEGAFSGCPLREIVLPEGIKSIEDNLFMGCYWLESVTIPKSVIEIYSHSFSECGLTNIIYNGTADELKNIDWAVYEEESISHIKIKCSNGKEFVMHNCGELVESNNQMCPLCNVCINEHVVCEHPGICQHEWCTHDTVGSTDNGEPLYCPDCNLYNDGVAIGIAFCKLCKVSEGEYITCDACNATIGYYDYELRCKYCGFNMYEP